MEFVSLGEDGFSIDPAWGLPDLIGGETRLFVNGRPLAPRLIASVDQTILSGGRFCLSVNARREIGYLSALFKALPQLTPVDVRIETRHRTRSAATGRIYYDAEMMPPQAMSRNRKDYVWQYGFVLDRAKCEIT